MRREVGIWSTFFLWIKLIYYWSGSFGNTMGMGGRDILFNHSSLCCLVMLRSSNQRWDSKMEQLEMYSGFNQDPFPERPIDISLLSLWWAPRKGLRSSTGTSYLCTEPGGQPWVEYFRLNREVTEHMRLHISWGNKAYGKPPQQNGATAFLVGRGEIRSQCLLEIWN